MLFAFAIQAASNSTVGTDDGFLNDLPQSPIALSICFR
jgi:hypothetical protein